MENKPTSRVAQALTAMPAYMQALSVAALFVLVFLFWLQGAVMGGKTKAPVFLLLLISVLYVIFALVFFDQYPGIVLAAGYILGAVHLSVFLITIFRSGDNNKDK